MVVAKVYSDVAYLAMAKNVYYIACFYSKCFICFRRMLDIAYVSRICCKLMFQIF
jgi:hypothetical protein